MSRIRAAAVHPQELARYQDRGHEMAVGRDLVPLQHLEQEGGAHAADLLEALMDGGEGGLRRRGGGDVVEADDGLVSR